MHDNTTRNEEHLFHDAAGPITNVREGMTVRDVTGQELGTVEYVKMGNPDAATAGGNTYQSNDLIEAAMAAFGTGSEVPEPERRQLLRYGFIRIDGPSLSDTDRFVRSDKIKEVSGETVTLAVSKDQLVSET
jgi:hypothetical protein